MLHPLSPLTLHLLLVCPIGPNKPELRGQEPKYIMQINQPSWDKQQRKEGQDIAGRDNLRMTTKLISILFVCKFCKR